MRPENLSDNVVLMGLVGAVVTGGLLWLFKAIPLAIVNAIIRATTVQVTISSDDKVFEWLNSWLASHSYSLRARVLRVSNRLLQADWSLVPGYGWHLLWQGRRPLLIRREINENVHGKVFGPPREKFIITTLGRSQE